MLDALREILTDYKGKMTALSNDIALFRLLALATILTDSVRSLEPIDIARIKENTSIIIKCILKSLSSTSPPKIRGKGLLGLLSAMQDKDIQTGLGLILAIAKDLGACIRSTVEGRGRASI